MKFRTKHSYIRIAYCALVAFVMYFGVVVAGLGIKGINRDMEVWAAETRMYDADTLIMHVDDSLNLCYNLGFIPYPLSWYIWEEAYQLTNPR